MECTRCGGHARIIGKHKTCDDCGLTYEVHTVLSQLLDENKQLKDSIRRLEKQLQYSKGLPPDTR